MPIVRVKEVRDMSSDDREKRLGELQTELVRLRTMIKAGGAVENPARVRELRKAIARILTVESEPALPKKEEKKEEKKEKKTRKEEKTTKEAPKKSERKKKAEATEA
jgi:large subunit ribosomal protein L29